MIPVSLWIIGSHMTAVSTVRKGSRCSRCLASLHSDALLAGHPTAHELKLHALLPARDRFSCGANKGDLAAPARRKVAACHRRPSIRRRRGNDRFPMLYDGRLYRRNHAVQDLFRRKRYFLTGRPSWDAGAHRRVVVRHRERAAARGEARSGAGTF